MEFYVLMCFACELAAGLLLSAKATYLSLQSSTVLT